MIYDPAEDSFLLEGQVRKFAHGKVLDMGVGSGYLAEEASKISKVKSVLAVDISNEVISFLKNKSNKKIKIMKSDLFSNVKERFDTIIFNPPYLPLDKREPLDSRLATTGGKHGYETLVRFLEDLDNHLAKNGIALILFSSLTNKNKIDSVIDEIGYEFELLSQKNVGFETLYVYKVKRNWLLNRLFDKKVTDIRKLAKGHRGVIFTGKYKGKKIAVKAQRMELLVRTVDREYDVIKKVNKKGLAPKLVFRGENYFAYEFIPGEFIIDFLERKNRNEIKKLLIEVLRQCRVLDRMKITKKEMTNPYKHVIIGKKVVLVDFERAHYDLNPQNVSQFCQYLIRNHDLFGKKGMKFSKDDVIELARTYKNEQTESNYKAITSFVDAS